MVAIDTNIVVRLLTQDDELQYRRSLEILQNQNVFIPDTVVLETEWVLRFAYKFKPVEICTALTNLFSLPNIYLSNTSLVFQALQWYESGLDFADSFHLAQSQNHEKFYTFDEKFVKKAKGLTTCEVNQP